MEAQSRSKRKFMVMVAMLVLIFVSIIVWSVAAYTRGESRLSEIALQGVVLLLILAFLLPVLKSARDHMKLGLPIEDERSRMIKMQAGSYAFMVSIYVWLGIMMFEEYFTVHSAGAFAILVGAVTFGLSWIILSRRPKLR